MSKRVLLISYYWPPAGGGGVQRWAKMSKYFSEFGWTPIVFVPENPDYPIIDHSFDEDVKDIECIKGKITEPSTILRKFGAGKTADLNAGFVSQKKSWFQNLAIAIRGNFFIPDARKWWIKPSVAKLDKWLKENSVDGIISTGPPHSAHMIALALKKKHALPWIADFRDPWTNIDFYKELRLTSWGDQKHHKMEKEVLENANIVVSIGKTMAKELSDLGAKNSIAITNGYDGLVPEQVLDDQFTVLHIGRLGAARNPLTLWRALAEFKGENHPICKDIKVRLVGNVDGEIMESINSFDLSEFVAIGKGVSNEQALQLQAKSQCLLLLINDAPNATGILPGKLFEYLSTKRPIICIGPKHGDAAGVLKETKAGKTFTSDDVVELKKELVTLHAAYKKGVLSLGDTSIDKYSRKALAEEYCKVLNQLL